MTSAIVALVVVGFLAAVSGEAKNPFLPYPVHFPHYYPVQPAPSPISQRGILQSIANLLPSTTTTTVVAVATCTVQTTACAGRRRRDLANEEEGAMDISPSAVQPVEPTPMADIDSSRQARQIGNFFPLFPDPDGPDVDGTFGELNEYVSQLYQNLNARPLGNFVFSTTYSVVPVVTLSYVRPTVTRTAYSISIVTSRPVCSVASNFPRCDVN